jgi:dynein heavy chain
LLENLKKVKDDMAALKGQALLTENRLIRAGKLTAALGDEAVSSNLVSKFMKLLH